MAFEIRSFEDCVKDLQATQPSKKLKFAKDASDEHYEMQRAVSFSKFDWPNNPPRSTLYLHESEEYQEADIFSDAGELMEYANFQAVGTWNANGEGTFYHSPGQWSILSAELLQEQDEWGDYVYLEVACWVVEEGIAFAVWKSNDCDTLATIMGLEEYPTGGESVSDLWHGE